MSFILFIDKIILKNDFEQKKKKPVLKFYAWLALIGLRTTELGPAAGVIS